MENTELLRRLAILKANPKLADSIPQSDVIKLVHDVVGAFNVIKTAIDNGKIKGEAGYTPVADVDYPSLNRYDGAIEQTISDLETNFAYALDTLEKKLATVKDGKDGEDAVITDEDKAEIAELAYNLIALPDFEEMVATEITRNGEAIRDSLELLQGDERYSVEIPDVKGLQEELDRLARLDGKGGGGMNIKTVIKLIEEYGGGTGTGIVETIVAGTGITVDDTDPANPIISATASAPAWGDITGTLSDQTDLQAALDLKQSEAVVVSSNQTAVNDAYYINVASATYTDPTPSEGKGFVVFVRNGTATVGGTGYSTAGTIIHRIYHSGAWANYVYQVSSTFALASHTHVASDVTDFSTAADARIAAAAGVSIASLSGGKIPTAQLPALALTDVFTVASQVAQLALTPEEGDVAIRTDQNKSYIHNGGVSGTMADWSELLTPTDTVLSVNGETGAVTLTTDDISDSGQTNKWATAGEKTKLGLITVTQEVDLNTLESDTATNNAKVTNATHTGEVTGSGALTVDKTAITNKTLVTAAVSDQILIADASDTDNLKRVTVQTIVDLASAGSGISEELAIAYAVAL